MVSSAVLRIASRVLASPKTAESLGGLLADFFALALGEFGIELGPARGHFHAAFAFHGFVHAFEHVEPGRRGRGCP